MGRNRVVAGAHDPRGVDELVLLLHRTERLSGPSADVPEVLPAPAEPLDLPQQTAVVLPRRAFERLGPVRVADKPGDEAFGDGVDEGAKSRDRPEGRQGFVVQWKSGFEQWGFVSG